MTGNMERRMDRLEHPARQAFGVGLAERVEAARKRWRGDPEGACRTAAERRRRFLAECDKAAAEGRTLTELQARLMHAYRRTGATQ